MPTPRKTTKKYSEPTTAYFDAVSHRLSDLRRINLMGEIGAGMHSHIENALAYMMSKDAKAPIEIIMSSPGGSVLDGFAIYDTITRYANKVPININVIGACMSMAVTILQAATTRRASPNSQFLMHEVSYGNRASLSGHEDEFLQATKLQKRLDDIIVARSGISLAELKTLTKRRDYAITAQEALKHGLIDSIYE